MAHRFVIQAWDGALATYDSFDAIPEDFQHVIEFKPELPAPPHGSLEHAELALWNGRLLDLMRRERQCRQRRASEMRT